jgi:hypothetical protein
VAGNGPQVLCGSHRFDPFGVWRDPVPKPVVMAVNGIAFTLSIDGRRRQAPVCSPVADEPLD